MTLIELCKSLTARRGNVLPGNHHLGPRLVCPEYSKSVQEVKTYPLLKQERLFALCWDIDAQKNLYATMYPSPEPFCYHYEYSAGEKTQLHTHDYIELGYVVSGDFRQKILGKDITFHKGDLCLIDKNCLHQDYLLDTPATILFLGIANDMFTEIMDGNVTAQKIVMFLKPALLKQKDLQQYLHFRPADDTGEAIEGCLFSLLTELRDNSIGSRHICKGLLMRIFHILGTKYEFSLSKEQQKTMNWLVFEEISEYIRQHFNTVTIRELSETFHFQEDYFNRLIKNKTGMTYSAYVQKFRLDKAAQLLTASSKSIEEIAEAVGYHNKGYFYKIFVKQYSMTPAQYRKTMEMM
ncbi:AraC family transcriptional regulator [Lachnospiraceae bacterium 48-42]|nr:AraC family transcriptional regulator [Dorea sp.]